MNVQTTLPLTDDKSTYEIRLESIGGLGANLCGKMLGQLGALYLNLNSTSFSSYGSEKRGSPVKSYIRWCPPEKELRTNSPVVRPDILVIFHEGLLGKHPVLEGITDHTKIILNTDKSAKEAARQYNIFTGTLYCMDALSLAMEYKSRVNMILFGAIVRVSDFIALSAAKTLCQDTIGKKYPDMIEQNLQGLQAGYDKIMEAPYEILHQEYVGQECAHPERSHQKTSSPKSQHSAATNDQYVWGYQNAPIGGVNPRIGSTISNDLSPSREGVIPLFIPERCIHCGLCDSTCPDMVFQFATGVYKGKKTIINHGLDYYHCKGCLRCVEICPTNALVEALEKDYPEKPSFVPNMDLLPNAMDYEKSGANPWVTSDSYLTEKRINGGLV